MSKAGNTVTANADTPATDTLAGTAGLIGASAANSGALGTIAGFETAAFLDPFNGLVVEQVPVGYVLASLLRWWSWCVKDCCAQMR